MGTRESSIQSRILKWLNAQPRTKAIVIHGGPFMEAGTPDIFVCTAGTPIMIEVKNEEYGRTAIQERRETQWLQSGCKYLTARSLKEVQEFFDTFRFI